jgi:cation:H+ antiporter
MSWMQILVYLALGFVLLDRGSDWLVTGGSRLARIAGLSPLVVGLTVVAWGTSLPEVVVSGLAAAKGHPEMSLGNVIGSNVSNIGLVLGIAGLILPRVLAGKLPGRDAIWLVGSLFVLALVILDGVISRAEGAGMLVLMVLYTLQAFRSARMEPEPAPPGEQDRHPLLHVALGMGAIALGAWLVTTGGAEGARLLGVPDRVVGLTVFAIGTSLPELAASVKGALRGECQIALGNVVGSNVFNTLAVLGVVAVIHPVGEKVEEGMSAGFEKALHFDLPVALGFSIALLVLPRLGGRRERRRTAACLLLLVLVYFTWLFVGGGPPEGS